MADKTLQDIKNGVKLQIKDTSPNPKGITTEKRSNNEKYHKIVRRSK